MVSAESVVVVLGEGREKGEGGQGCGIDYNIRRETAAGLLDLP